MLTDYNDGAPRCVWIHIAFKKEVRRNYSHHGIYPLINTTIAANRFFGESKFDAKIIG